MTQETLRDLLLEELKDVYDAEQQIVRALPKMSAATSDIQLQNAFNTHLQQSQEQIWRLEQVFSVMGEPVESKPCKAMRGLIAEGEDLMQEYSMSSLLDAALIGAAQRVEHYEIAAYGTARAYAAALGEQDVVNLLEETLNEEKETDDLLSDLGYLINQQCVQFANESGYGTTGR
jgi:ferritin-like metal-binding protein YciE